MTRRAILSRSEAAPLLRRCAGGAQWLSILALCGCAGIDTGATDGPSATPSEIGIVVFGDHGYHLDFLDRKEYEPPRSREQFIAAERADWADDKRPAAEFEPPAMTKGPNGSWVAASGMMPVARAIEAFCRQPQRCDLATMLGDNIYPAGAAGDDARGDAILFDKIFGVPYGRFGDLAPDFRIYAVLGNHDWKTSRSGAMAQAAYLARTPPFYMDGIVYHVQPPAARGEVELFALDTTVLLAGHPVYEDALADDASELPATVLEGVEPWVVPATQGEREMVATLERALRNSTARWKIVIGHHPLWSSAGSKYEQARVLRSLILPTLCRYADAYLAGHDHTLELHLDDCSVALPGEHVAPLPSIVSGAASKQRALNTAFMRHQAAGNPQLRTAWARGMIWGFAHLSLAGEEATLRFIETPDDGSGEAQLTHTARFARRSHTPREGT